MKKKLLIPILLLYSISNQLFSQTTRENLYMKMRHADSILIVSHLLQPIIDEKTEEVIGIEELVINNKPNISIIKQSYRLNEKDIDTIAILFTTHFSETEFAEKKCFEPHHGVLIFSNGTCSWVEICFSCRHFISSADIQLSDMLNYKTWDEMAVFFKRRKCSYKIAE